MRRLLQTGLLLFLCTLFIKSEAQTDQTVGNGAKTGPFTFPGPDCTYKWTNNNPSIGLPANGTGNIPSFAAINNSNGPVTGTITAMPSALNGFAYITNSSGKSVSVIDITTDKVVATIQVGDNPAGVAISPDGTRVYVTNQGAPSVSVINALTNQVIANISMPLNSDPSGIVISPDGATLYICAFNQNTVFVVNTVSNTITANITVGANPWQMAISSDGKLLYVASPSSNNISVVNTSSNAVIATVPLSLPPTGMALSPDGSKLYTENYNSNTVSIISTSNFTVIGTATVGANPVAAAVTPDGSRIYVSNGYDNTVSVVNAANNATIATIPVGVTVGMIGVSRDGSKVYAIIVSEGKVVVISTKTNSVIATVPVGLGPESLGNFVGGCPAVTFKITVNSGPTPVVTTSTITGNIIGCVGSPGESPNVGKFTVAGTSLTGDITVTPPPGFDLSLTAIGGYSTSLTLKQIGGTVINVPIYIRSSAADPVGPISGNIQLTTPGATADVVPVTGVVNALPTVDPVQNVKYNNGQTTLPISFTGTGNTFTWTNDKPSIGLPASGTGDIAAFTAINAGNTPVTATVTGTPYFDNLAFIVDNYSNYVSVIDLRTNTIVSVITVGYGPTGIVMSPDHKLIYVSNAGSNTVSVINISTKTVITTIPVGSSPMNLTTNSNGTTLYVSNIYSNSVSVIDTKTNSVITTVPTGQWPGTIKLSPDGSKAYVVNQYDGTISVINTNTNSVSATILIAQTLCDESLSPDGSKLYVLNNYFDRIYVINTANNSIIANIPVGNRPEQILLSPDGSRAYVTILFSSSVSVINTVTNSVITNIPVGQNPGWLALSSNKQQMYVMNTASNSLSTIDLATNSVISTIQTGSNPGAFVIFDSNASGCPGAPIAFTITVNSLSPSITAGTASGTISACLGSASASPNIQLFTVSGSNLTGDIIATAPTGFEVSLSQGSGFGNTLTIPQAAGTVSNATVYVRSAASDPSGSISGNVVLTSPGATSQNVAVSGTVNALPTVNAVTNQTKNNGAATDVINFTGTGGDTYNWTNDVPGIGLPASGTGNIPSFNAIDVNGDTPVTATLTVTPVNTLTGCTGTPVTFTITVNPASAPVISSSGTLTGLSTIYGTSSSSESFTVSASNTTAGILVTAPQGFELSTDNNAFSAAVTAGQAGTIANVPVYIRLAATSPVNNYSGDLVLSTAGATDVNVNMPLSAVNRAVLTVTAPDVTRAFGVPNPVFVPQYLGFVNGENQSVLAILPQLTTIATPSSAVGQYPIHVSGGSALNYTIFPVDGTLTIVPAPSEIVVPNAFTPNGDGVNDFWNIKALVDFPQCIVSIYSRYGNLVFQSRGYGKPWDGTQNGAPVPTGTYYYVIDPNEAGLQLLSGYVAVLR